MIATTKGDADAPVLCLFANESLGELYGTRVPILEILLALLTEVK